MISLYDLNKVIPLEQRANDVLCVGEILVDLIAADDNESLSGQAFYPYFGGSPANIAINTKRLGINSQIVGSVGEDRFGDYLISYLNKEDIETSFINRTSQSTSMVVLNRSVGTPVPTFYRAADYHIYYSYQIKQLLELSSIVHISSWPASAEPANKAVLSMIEDAKRNNTLVGFDPNFHASVWCNGDNPKADFLHILSKADVIKPSLDDAKRIFGSGNDITQLKRFIDIGAKLVILTLGADGALVSNGKQTLHFPTMATEVVDATGAGDAFWSGFYVGIIKKLTVKQAVKIGLAVSAHKLKHVGAITPLPKLNELTKLYQL